MMNEEIRILHVDDASDARDSVKTILEKEGYTVVGVESGKQALEHLGDNKFDLVILDVMMPDMSGWELFTEMSNIRPGYKVVFLTILEVSEGRIDQYKERGILDYITKPFDRDDFVARVNKVLAS